MNSSKHSNKTAEAFNALLRSEDNRRCFDCPSRCPTFVNTTINAFVCASCAGILREFEHRLKSISASSFSDEELSALAGGNAAARKIWMASWSEAAFPEPNGFNEEALRLFLREKYIRKRFYKAPDPLMAQQSDFFNQTLSKTRKPLEVRMASVPATSSFFQTNATISSPSASNALDLLFLDAPQQQPEQTQPYTKLPSNSPQPSFDHLFETAQPLVPAPSTSTAAPPRFACAFDSVATHPTDLTHSDKTNTSCAQEDDFGDFQSSFPSYSPRLTQQTSMALQQPSFASFPAVVPPSQSTSPVFKTGSSNAQDQRQEDKYAALREVANASIFSHASQPHMQQSPTHPSNPPNSSMIGFADFSVFDSTNNVTRHASPTINTHISNLDNNLPIHTTHTQSDPWFSSPSVSPSSTCAVNPSIDIIPSNLPTSIHDQKNRALDTFLGDTVPSMSFSQRITRAAMSISAASIATVASGAVRSVAHDVVQPVALSTAYSVAGVAKAVARAAVDMTVSTKPSIQEPSMKTTSKSMSVNGSVNTVSQMSGDVSSTVSPTSKPLIEF